MGAILSPRPGIVLLLTFLFACSAGGCDQTQVIIPTPPQPVSGSATIAGAVPSAINRWRNQAVVIYAAPYKVDDSGEGFFLLEPNLHPHADLQGGGGFVILNLPPGQYVLVAGPTPEEARLVVGKDGDAVIFTFFPDEASMLGELNLAQ